MSAIAAPNTIVIKEDSATLHPLPPTGTSPTVSFRSPMPLAAYHTFLAAAENKYEYINGGAIEMAGASPEHNRICADFLTEANVALQEAAVNCEVFGSDQKVYISRRLIYLPDISIACGDAQIDFDDCLRNPVAIVEVLSPSTAVYDITEKFRNHRRLASLAHYIVIGQTAPAVTYFAKTETGLWAIVGDFTQLSESLTLPLGDKTITLPLSRIYRRVAFPAIEAQE